MLTLSEQADMSLAAARARLAPERRRHGFGRALIAAALAAIAALALAGAVILGPPSAQTLLAALKAL
jgi:GNAT superfamily N-acetyltransferase